MKRNKNILGSEILDEVWHATARAPRSFPGDHTYMAGLDVLGAGIALPSVKKDALKTAGISRSTALSHVAPKAAAISRAASGIARGAVSKALPAAAKALPKAVVTRAVKVGNRAVAVSRKVALRSPRLAKKLASAGNKLLNKATRIKGDDGAISRSALTSVVSDADAINAYMVVISSTDAFAQAGEIYNAVLTTVDQLKTANLADLAATGQAIADDIQKLADNYNPDVGDPAMPGQVSTLSGRANTFQAQAKTALSGGGASAPGAFSPGTPGGGGGGGGSSGGGEDDSSASSGAPSSGEGDESDVEPPESSEAVQRFRDSGGQWNPFEDEGDGGESSASTGAYASAQEDLDSGTPVDDTAQEESEVTSDDSVEAKKAALEEDMVGLEYSDYHFEAGDLFMPHQALQRTIQEKEAKDAAAAASTPSPFSTDVTVSPQGKLSPAVAKRLAAAKKKLADLQRQESAARTAQVANSTFAPDASQSEGDSVMGLDEEDLEILGALAEAEGIPMEEAADIIMEQFQHQVTDAPFDPERTHGSSHRGAAYLNHDTKYPPWVASAGMEGGLIQPEETLEIFGEKMDKDIKIMGSEYSRGLDVLGAGVSSKAVASAVVPRTLKGKIAAAKANVVPRAGFVLKKTPGGNKVTSLVLNSPKKGNHQASIKNAKDAGQRAISLGNKLAKALAKGAAKTSVHGLAHTLAPVKRGAHKPMTVAQMKQVADRAVKVGKDTLTHASKHATLVSANAAHLKSAVAAVQAKMSLGKGMATRIHGDGGIDPTDVHVFGALCEMLGDELTSPPDDTTTAAVADDAGIGAPPTKAPDLVPGQDYDPDPGLADVMFSSDSSKAEGAPLPVGAVVYDGSHGYPYDGFTSLSRAQQGGGDADGYYFSGSTGPGEFRNTWIRRTAGKDYPIAGGDAAYINLKPRGPADNWGPLVGNTVMAKGDNDWLDGLRFDYGGQRFFWYRNKAPTWATAADDQARLNQAILDYKAQVATAAADAAAQAVQDQLDKKNAADLAKQQAAEDAATARRQQQEQAEQEHQAALQTVADEQAAATAQKDDERKAAAAEQQAQLEEERQARMEERQAELDAKMAERQADIDAKAEERRMAAEEQAMETAARLDALAPPTEEDQEAAVEANDDTNALDVAENLDSGMTLDDGTVMGALRGSARVRARAHNRRG